MLRCTASLFAFLVPCAAFAQAPVALHASYETYAAGLDVARIQAALSLGPWTYQINLDYQTAGMAGFFFRGHQSDVVTGTWHGSDAAPSRFTGEGTWRGVNRIAEIEYQQGKPSFRQLAPPNTAEREAVPEGLQVNAIDTLSALAELIRKVAASGRCDTTVHTFDGRRAVEIIAQTVGEEVLTPTSRSSFAGKALRCDFSGRMLAGFLFGDNRERDSKPMHGSAWLAPVAAGAPPMPVRMAFETRWFGDATMYLTGIGPGADVKLARGN